MNTIPRLYIHLKGLGAPIKGGAGDYLVVRDASLSSVFDVHADEVLPDLIQVTGTQEIWDWWHPGFSEPPPNWPTKETVLQTPFWERVWVFASSLGQKRAEPTFVQSDPIYGWAFLGTKEINIVVPATKVSYHLTATP